LEYSSSFPATPSYWAAAPSLLRDDIFGQIAKSCPQARQREIEEGAWHRTPITIAHGEPRASKLSSAIAAPRYNVRHRERLSA
jgi:hypothetical protein